MYKTIHEATMKILLALLAIVFLFTACSNVENKPYQTKLTDGRAVLWDTKACVWRNAETLWPIAIDWQHNNGWALDLFNVCWRENRAQREKLPKVIRP